MLRDVNSIWTRIPPTSPSLLRRVGRTSFPAPIDKSGRTFDLEAGTLGATLPSTAKNADGLPYRSEANNDHLLLMQFQSWDAVGHPTVAYSGCNLSGINESGQVPDSNLRQLIDSDRPQKKVYLHGHSKMYHLVLSDGYEQDGTFHCPRDNP
ncbi:hypothetical protein K525DRAFT_272282 [Schizophyllum commune Loenen D]|nr:hypothetical protein K525DRAFT_272282 [Schizophyllum commune Loenen D]